MSWGTSPEASPAIAESDSAGVSLEPASAPADPPQPQHMPPLACPTSACGRAFRGSNRSPVTIT